MNVWESPRFVLRVPQLRVSLGADPWHLVAAVGSVVWQSLTDPFDLGRVGRRCSSKLTPWAREGESCWERESKLPRVREPPRVRGSSGAKVAARVQVRLSGRGSLPEKVRVAEAGQKSLRQVKRDQAEERQSARRLRSGWAEGRQSEKVAEEPDRGTPVWEGRGEREGDRRIKSASDQGTLESEKVESESAWSYSAEKTATFCFSKQVCCRRRGKECEGLLQRYVLIWMFCLSQGHVCV